MGEPSKDYFENLECHFNWNIRSIVGNRANIDKKLAEKSEEISGQPWRTLIISVTSVYELFIKNDPGASKELKICTSLWENNEDPFILKYKDAFQHVLFSVELFIIKETNPSPNVIKKILDLIPPVAGLTNDQKHAITAIKAHVFSEYGPPGTKHALTLAKQLVKDDPEEGEWHFLLGKMMSRIRHFYIDRCVTEEELQCFRIAHAKHKSAATAVFLAQTNCELARKLFIKAGRVANGNDGRIIKKYNEQAYKLFKEALQLNNNKCSHINFRCANGLRLLPMEFKDLKLAFELTQSTLQRAPTNVYGNSVACSLYQATKQYDIAIMHGRIAVEGGSFGCAMKVFNINVILNKEMDEEKEFEDLIKKFPEDMFVEQTYLGAMSYFIFKKYDLYKALNYFFKAADMNLELARFNQYITWVLDEVDLCFVMYNEVKCAVEGKKAETQKQRTMLRNALTCIYTTYPTVTERKVKSTLVKEIVNRYSKMRCQRNPVYNKNYNKKINDNNHNVNKEKIEKRNKQWNFRNNRSRSSIECKNNSKSLDSSLADTKIFRKMRRNKKEESMLNIIVKDFEIENRLENIKLSEGKEVTTLRPETDKVSNNVAASQMVLGKPSLNLGCKGWGPRNNFKEDKNLLLKTSDPNLKTNCSNRPRTPMYSNFKSDNGSRQQKTSNKSNYRTGSYQSNNRNQISKLVDKEKVYYSAGASNISQNESNSFEHKPRYTNSRGNSFTPPYLNDRREKNSPKLYTPYTGTVRKPFNLRISRESLDSDDSELSSLNSNLDRLSISSADNLRGRKTSHFKWNT